MSHQNRPPLVFILWIILGFDHQHDQYLCFDPGCQESRWMVVVNNSGLFHLPRIEPSDNSFFLGPYGSRRFYLRSRLVWCWPVSTHPADVAPFFTVHIHARECIPHRHDFLTPRLETRRASWDHLHPGQLHWLMRSRSQPLLLSRMVVTIFDTHYICPQGCFNGWNTRVLFPLNEAIQGSIAQDGMRGHPNIADSELWSKRRLMWNRIVKNLPKTKKWKIMN